MLRLDSSKDFQAIVTVARSVFELAVDLKLLEETPGDWMKMKFHVDVDKLRAAKKIVAFKNNHSGEVQTDTTVYEKYIAENSTRIEANAKILWPNNPSPLHWSNMTLKNRCIKLKAPYEQMYEEDYPRMSFSIHPGLTSVINLQAETFVHFCAYAYNLAAKCYGLALSILIAKFQLFRGNSDIHNRLDVSFKFPFADTPEQEEVSRMKGGEESRPDDLVSLIGSETPACRSRKTNPPHRAHRSPGLRV